jgi:branched-chain amino acid transport system substrate-binding protein
MIPQLTNIGGTSAEAVVCWTTDKDAATVALDMDTLQMEMTLYCSHGIANMDFITAAGDAANGVIFPAGKLLVVEDLPADDPQKEVLTQYRDDYEAIYGSGTISTFGGHAYDALEMVVMALEDLDTIYFPENAVLADVRAALRTGIEGTTDFIGISGIFTMSPTNHLGMQPGSLVLIEIVDQQWTPLAQ